MGGPIQRPSSTAATPTTSGSSSTSSTEKGSSRAIELAKEIFSSSVGSFQALPLPLQANVIIEAIQIHGVDKLSIGGYLTQNVIGNALNRGLSLEGLIGKKTIIDTLIQYDPKSKKLTIAAYDLEEDKLIALLQQMQKEELSSCTTVCLNNTAISSFKLLALFPDVETVIARECRALASLEGISKKVTTLDISSSEIVNFEELAGTNIAILSASDCQKLESLSGLEKLPLQSLDLSGDLGIEWSIGSPTPLEQMSELGKLQTLILKDMPLLEEDEVEAFRKKYPKITVIS